MEEPYTKPVKFGPLYLIGTILAGFALFAGIMLLTGVPSAGWQAERLNGASSSEPAVKLQVPIEVTGIWESDSENARFVASITDRSIDIDLETPQGSLAYWSGTFERPTSDADKIQSIPDPTKLTWSNSTTKEFTYLDGKIAFDYSAPGITAGIVLHRR